jgi:hypothetical protein
MTNLPLHCWDEWVFWFNLLTPTVEDLRAHAIPKTGVRGISSHFSKLYGTPIQIVHSRGLRSWLFSGYYSVKTRQPDYMVIDNFLSFCSLWLPGRWLPYMQYAYLLLFTNVYL